MAEARLNHRAPQHKKEPSTGEMGGFFGSRRRLIDSDRDTSARHVPFGGCLNGARLMLFGISSAVSADGFDSRTSRFAPILRPSLSSWCFSRYGSILILQPILMSDLCVHERPRSCPKDQMPRRRNPPRISIRKEGAHKERPYKSRFWPGMARFYHGKRANILCLPLPY